MKKKDNGFTLIELLVAMTIVAVLVALALVSLQGAKRSARDGKRRADLEEVRSALEMYRADEGEYPAGPLTSGQSIASATMTYMTIPFDPIDPTGATRMYRYKPNVAGVSYYLCVALEGSTSVISGCAVGDCGGVFDCNYETHEP